MSHSSLLTKIILVLSFLAVLVSVGDARADSAYSFAIEVDGTLLGNLNLDVYQDLSVPGVENSIGIQGGFQDAGNLSLPSGFEYRWIQTVTSSSPAYDWQQPGTPYVDRTRINDENGVPRLAMNSTPFYGEISGPDDVYTLPFGDNPARPADLGAFEGTWTLSLVAVQAPQDPLAPFNTSIPGSGRAIYEITSLVWGFSVTLDSAGQSVVDLKVPFAQGPSGGLRQAFANDVLGGGDPRTFGGGAWSFENGFPGRSVPEPSSLMMGLASAALFTAMLARRSGRRARAA